MLKSCWNLAEIMLNFMGWIIAELMLHAEIMLIAAESVLPKLKSCCTTAEMLLHDMLNMCFQISEFMLQLILCFYLLNSCWIHADFMLLLSWLRLNVCCQDAEFMLRLILCCHLLNSCWILCWIRAEFMLLLSWLRLNVCCQMLNSCCDWFYASTCWIYAEFMLNIISEVFDEQTLIASWMRIHWRASSQS